MMLKALIIVATVALPTQGQEWTHDDTLIELSCFFVMALDWGQTRTISLDDEWYELNPLLGKKPNIQTVDTYFAVFFLGHALAIHSLPKEQRRMFQTITIICEGGVVGHNYAYGIKVRLW